jgi:hypothetical protein
MRHRPTLCMVALVILAAAAAGSTTAQPNRSEFESHAWYTAIPEGGDITCPGGGEPSTSLFPPWCGEDRTKVRGRVLTGFIDLTSDERVAGTNRIVMNMNLDASFEGPIWGTYEIEVPGRGAWEGTWQGKYHGPLLATYRLVAHGSGEFEGLELRADLAWQAGQGESWTGEIFGALRQK